MVFAASREPTTAQFAPTYAVLATSGPATKVSAGVGVGAVVGVAVVGEEVHGALVCGAAVWGAAVLGAAVAGVHSPHEIGQLFFICVTLHASKPSAAWICNHSAHVQPGTVHRVSIHMAKCSSQIVGDVVAGAPVTGAAVLGAAVLGAAVLGAAVSGVQIPHEIGQLFFICVTLHASKPSAAWICNHSAHVQPSTVHRMSIHITKCSSHTVGDVVAGVPVAVLGAAVTGAGVTGAAGAAACGAGVAAAGDGVRGTAVAACGDGVPGTGVCRGGDA
eukprot:gene3159-25081_t